MLFKYCDMDRCAFDIVRGMRAGAGLSISSYEREVAMEGVVEDVCDERNDTMRLYRIRGWM